MCSSDLAFCGAWSRCGCPLDCWAARHCHGKSAPFGGTNAPWHSEDSRMKAAFSAPAAQTQFHLQTAYLPKSVQKILQVEVSNVPLPGQSHSGLREILTAVRVGCAAGACFYNSPPACRAGRSMQHSTPPPPVLFPARPRWNPPVPSAPS